MKKQWILWLVLVLTIVSCGVVYAVEVLPDTTEAEAYAEALVAGDVCAEHLLQNCEECERATYTRECPMCGTVMTRCCDDDVADKEIYTTCNVKTHPDNCDNIQTWHWNYYFCKNCGHNTRGTAPDDKHLESYDHNMCNCNTKCKNNTYCHLTRLCVLKGNYKKEQGLPTAEELQQMRASAEQVPDGTEHTYEEAVVAGDFCEVHGIFGCDIAIETDDE